MMQSQLVDSNGLIWFLILNEFNFSGSASPIFVSDIERTLFAQRFDNRFTRPVAKTDSGRLTLERAETHVSNITLICHSYPRHTRALRRERVKPQKSLEIASHGCVSEVRFRMLSAHRSVLRLAANFMERFSRYGKAVFYILVFYRLSSRVPRVLKPVLRSTEVAHPLRGRSEQLGREPSPTGVKAAGGLGGTVNDGGGSVSVSVSAGWVCLFVSVIVPRSARRSRAKNGVAIVTRQQSTFGARKNWQSTIPTRVETSKGWKRQTRKERKGEEKERERKGYEQDSVGTSMTPGLNRSPIPVSTPTSRYADRAGRGGRAADRPSPFCRRAVADAARRAGNLHLHLRRAFLSEDPLVNYTCFLNVVSSLLFPRSRETIAQRDSGCQDSSSVLNARDRRTGKRILPAEVELEESGKSWSNEAAKLGECQSASVWP
ncbi:hypothetical protein DBV15_02025 [Temnothorax longispinosus]|uniref:Uncharacterized protein n=1 Tax=Temnothorax longispinosus TaxID=300112 RepID=A0A4S2KP67_9HYME|nr:hypothetical protein DBV15_02025 [Temnothorax longispinosus]